MPATQHSDTLPNISQPQTLHRQLTSESSRHHLHGPATKNLHLNQHKQGFLQIGWCSFFYARCTGARIPGRKQWNKLTGVSCPHTNVARLLRGTLPFGLQGLFPWMKGQTCSVANCSYSHVLLLLPPSGCSTAQYPWLTHGTCPSPQHLPTHSKSLQFGFQQIQVHICIYSLSWQHGGSPALTLECSNQKVPNPVNLIPLNSTNLGKNGKNMPNLTCDSTICYTHWAYGEEVISRFLSAPWFWKLEPCFFLGKAGRGCSAQYRLPFAYKMSISSSPRQQV